MKQNIHREKTSWNYTQHDDLTEELINTTIDSYNTGFKQYAEDWEWSDQIQLVTRKNYLHPFMEHLKEQDNVLVIGSGTGRDLVYLKNHGFQCMGIDKSINMHNEALRRGVNCPLIHDDVQTFSGVTNSLDSILCESALEHIPKTKIFNLLNKLITWTRPEGTILLRLRLGIGKVFVTKDEVGIRYFTSFREEEILSLFTGIQNFSIIETSFSPHLDNSRPGFYLVIGKKK